MKIKQLDVVNWQPGHGDIFLLAKALIPLLKGISLTKGWSYEAVPDLP